MTAAPNNGIGLSWRDVYDLVAAVDERQTTRFDAIDGRLDKIEGRLMPLETQAAVDKALDGQTASQKAAHTLDFRWKVGIGVSAFFSGMGLLLTGLHSFFGI